MNRPRFARAIVWEIYFELNRDAMPTFFCEVIFLIPQTPWTHVLAAQSPIFYPTEARLTTDVPISELPGSAPESPKVVLRARAPKLTPQEKH